MRHRLGASDAQEAGMTRYAVDPVALLDLARTSPHMLAEHQLVAPHSLRSLALELLLTDVAAGKISEREALEVHDRLTAIKVRLLGDRVSRRMAWKVAREHGWTTLFRAEYIAVAMLQADFLIAGDPDLRKAAKAHVELATLTELE